MSSDIVDAIGGWKTSGVGHGYGNGYPLEVLERVDETDNTLAI